MLQCGYEEGVRIRGEEGGKESAGQCGYKEGVRIQREEDGKEGGKGRAGRGGRDIAGIARKQCQIERAG